MHELSLVQGIIDAVEEFARQKDGKVKSVKVRVGELAQFDVRLVKELLVELKSGTELEDATISVEPERTKVGCLSCASEWNFDDLVGPLPSDEREMVHFFPELLGSYSKCPACSMSFFEIKEGRSVRIQEVTLDV